MKSYEFLRKIYHPIGNFALTNQNTFVKSLVESAGSSFFSDKTDKNYPNRFISGKQVLTLPLKRSFNEGIDKHNLINFFINKIPDTKLHALMESFDIEESAAPSKSILAEALANQFALFVNSEENDIPDIVADTYYRLKCCTSSASIGIQPESTPISDEYQKNPWRYSIAVLDDTVETLEILQDAVESQFINEKRYEIDIFTCTKTTDVIEHCFNSNVDVLVLDVARKAWDWAQAKEHDYFGYDLFKLLVYEQPNTLVKTKFIFYSKLPRTCIQREFGQLTDFVQETLRQNHNNVAIPEIEYLKKQNTSASDVAKRIKEHLDLLYQQESSKNSH